MADLRQQREKLRLSTLRQMQLSEPKSWDWARPYLFDSVYDLIEQGDPRVAYLAHAATLVRQVGLQLGRKALRRLFETGEVNPGAGYRPVEGEHRDSVLGLFQIAHHAYVLAQVEVIAEMDRGIRTTPGIFERAARLLLDWVRDSLSVQEMYEGMSLEVVHTMPFSYSWLHAWERVHNAMRAIPGASVSVLGRVSLTRMVYGWFTAPRPYGREHEMELLSMLDLYSRVEREYMLAYGHSLNALADLYEVKDQYYRFQVLDTKRRAAAHEQPFLEEAPMLGLLGGAMPHTQLLTYDGARAIHRSAALPHSIPKTGVVFPPGALDVYPHEVLGDDVIEYLGSGGAREDLDDEVFL